MRRCRRARSRCPWREDRFRRYRRELLDHRFSGPRPCLSPFRREPLRGPFLEPCLGHLRSPRSRMRECRRGPRRLRRCPRSPLPRRCLPHGRPPRAFRWCLLSRGRLEPLARPSRRSLQVRWRGPPRREWRGPRVLPHPRCRPGPPDRRSPPRCQEWPPPLDRLPWELTRRERLRRALPRVSHPRAGAVCRPWARRPWRTRPRRPCWHRLERPPRPRRFLPRCRLAPRFLYPRGRPRASARPWLRCRRFPRSLRFRFLLGWLRWELRRSVPVL